MSVSWAFVNAGASANIASGNLTLAEPAGCASGDLLVAVIAVRNSAPFTLPTGWTVCNAMYTAGETTTNAQASGLMAYTIRGAGTANLLFQRTGGNTAVGGIVAYRQTVPFNVGASPAFMQKAVGQTMGSNVGRANVVGANTITTTAGQELLVMAACLGNALCVASGPTVNNNNPSWTSRANSNCTTNATARYQIFDCADASGYTAVANCGNAGYTSTGTCKDVIILASFFPSLGGAYSITEAGETFSSTGKANVKGTSSLTAEGSSLTKGGSTLTRTQCWGEGWIGPTSGLTHRWPMTDDYVSGSTVTDVVGGLHGTITGSPTVTSAAGPNASLTARQFPGGGATITLPSCPITCSAAYTIGFWALINDIEYFDSSGYPRLFNFYDAGNIGLCCTNRAQEVNGQLVWSYNSATYTGYTGMWANSQWVHTAVSFDGASTYKIYKNGSLVSPSTPSSSDNSVAGNLFGGRTTAERRFKGRLRSFCTYNRVLSDAEVLQLKNADLVLPSKTIFITDTACTQWTVPGDWNSSCNKIEAIGGGGGGARGAASAGGGGEYRGIVNFAAAPGTAITVTIGVGGNAGTLSFANGAPGTNTVFKDTSTLVAVGGGGGGTTSAGAGGTGGVGTLSANGGGSGNAYNNSGSGGGGAGGTRGVGAAGGDSNAGGASGAGGGGGGGGGTIGHTGVLTSGTGAGGDGGDSCQGSGHGAGGATEAAAGSAGTDGGGGGGGGGMDAISNTGGNGAAGGTGSAEWTQTSNSATAGAGGGGGGGGAGSTGGACGAGGNGALYGGGGGCGGSGVTTGQLGGNGAQGIIVVTYTPTIWYTSTPPGTGNWTSQSLTVVANSLLVIIQTIEANNTGALVADEPGKSANLSSNNGLTFTKKVYQSGSLVFGANTTANNQTALVIWTAPVPSVSQKTIFIDAASSSPWTVPVDWNSGNNVIECIGGGGGGADQYAAGANSGSGGGGGAYSKAVNVTLTAGGSANFSVGQGGANAIPAVAGGNTWFGGTQYSDSLCAAQGGAGGATGTGGAGGANTLGRGTLLYGGGNGIAQNAANNASFIGGAGGGAGGPHGFGANGGPGPSDGTAAQGSSGGGGGGGGGGAIGGSHLKAQGSDAGVGGTNWNSAGAGAAGTTAHPTGYPGTVGGGGGGGVGNNSGTSAGAGGAGGPGTEWDSTHGSGGGGGGGGAVGSAAGINPGIGGNGGLYGGGAGGGGGGDTGSNRGFGGKGANGIIVVTYTPADLSTITLSGNCGTMNIISVGLVAYNYTGSVGTGVYANVTTSTTTGAFSANLSSNPGSASEVIAAHYRCTNVATLTGNVAPDPAWTELIEGPGTYE